MVGFDLIIIACRSLNERGIDWRLYGLRYLAAQSTFWERIVLLMNVTQKRPLVDALGFIPLTLLSNVMQQLLILSGP